MSELESYRDETLDMLRQKGIKRFAEVWTADDVSIGEAIRLHHRTHNVNPDLKLYQTYLESKSIEMGGSVYIPTDFVADYDPAAGKVILAVNIKTVQRETWERAPDFIAHHTSQVEELPV
ncbi:MAG TPA: hypothetical protein PLD25_00645 [Chloroflexota bacterium]|nr:hypothetical protein [Chloroflexota bacterium]HUM70649.1 hypothetical protein [Chloroflexota bacterium]